MAALNSPKTLPPSELLARLQTLSGEITLRGGDTFLWSPGERTVQYVEAALHENTGQWSLLHELSHALLDHQTYSTDFELLRLELAAWKKAKELATPLGLKIDANYIEDCLDTYRDWLHQRSTCPTCGNGGLQHDPREYRCHNCLTTWHVSQSRFCRPYRMKQVSGHTKKSPDRDQTTFQ